MCSVQEVRLLLVELSKACNAVLVNLRCFEKTLIILRLKTPSVNLKLVSYIPEDCDNDADCLQYYSIRAMNKTVSRL